MVVDNVKQATTTTAYANAVKGLSLEQAKLALSTKQLSALEKEQILIKAGLLNATGKLTTGQLTEILTTKERNTEDAKALLLSTGLISAETAEATAVNVVETAKLEELVATKQLTVAEAELIAMKAKVTAANIKEASTTTAVSGKMAGSISILGSSVGSALTKIGSGLLSFASAHPVIAALTAIVGLVGITNSQLKKYEQEQKELIENAKTLQDEYRSFVQSSSDNINSLKAQADEFEELSKGVTKYGENISLSADEYDRYKSIVAEVLGYTPELKEAYDKEGTAIANKNSLIERSIELMKEEQRQKLKEMTTDEKTGVAYEGAKAEWDDANAGYEGAHTRNEIARWFENNSTSNGWNYEVDIAKILGIKDEWSDEGNNLQNAIINNIDTVAENIKNKKAELLALEDEKGVALFTEAEIDNMIEKANDWEKAYVEWQQEIEDSKHGMDDQFALYAQRADGYDDLTDAQRAFVDEYIKATGDIVDADGHILSEDEMIEKAESYEKFVDKLATSPEFADARKKINELFALDSSTIPAGEYEKKVNDILEELQTKFDLTDDEVKDFKIALGFDFIEDGSSTRVSELVKKVQGKLKDNFDDKALDLSLDDLIIASNLEVPEDVELSWEEFIKLLNEAKDIPDEITDLKTYLDSTIHAETKEKLLDLAKSGELTPETLSSTEEYNTILKELQITAEDATNQILDMLSAQEKLSSASQGLDKLKSAYEEFKDEDIGFVTAETLESLPDAFKNLPEFDLFSQIVGDPTSGAQAIQQAFNDICRAYLFSQDTLQGLVGASDHEIQSYIANLKQMGISNSEELVNQTIAVLNEENELINAAEEEYYNAYLKYLESKDKSDLEYLENSASNNGQLVSALGSSYKSDYDNWCDLLAQKATAYNNFINALGGSYDSSKSVIQNMLDNGQNIGANSLVEAYTAQAEHNKIVQQAEQMKNALKLDYSPIETDFGTTYSPSTSSSSKDSSKDSTETFDWIENKLKAISNEIDTLDTKAGATWDTWANRNKALSQELGKVTGQIKIQEKAANKYLSLFNGVNISDAYRKKIMSGEMNIEEITNEELADKIKKAQEYWDNYITNKNDANEGRNTLASKVKEQFDNLKSESQANIDAIESQIDKLNDNMDIAETKGYYITEDYYNNLINKENDKISALTSQAKTLQDQLDSAVANGIKKGSEDWQSMKDEIDSVIDEINETKKSIIELQVEIAKTNFENIQTKAENFKNAIEHEIQIIESGMNLRETIGKKVSGDSYDSIELLSLSKKANLEQEISDLYTGLKKFEVGTQNYEDALQEIREKEEELAQLEVDIAQNTIDRFNNEMEKASSYDRAEEVGLNHKISKQNTAMELKELNGQLVTSSDYDVLNNYQKRMSNNLQDQYNQMVSALEEAISRGEIKIGDDNWIQAWEDIYAKDEEIAESNKTIAENTKKGVDADISNVQEGFDKIQNAYAHESSVIQGAISNYEANGYSATEELYDALIQNSENSISAYKNEKSRLEKILNDGLLDGSIVEGDDQYWTIIESFNDIDSSIIDAENDIVGFNNSIQQLKWDSFDSLMDKITDITEETNFLNSLIEESDWFDDTGKITGAGEASAALHLMNINTYKSQVKDYGKELLKINKDLASDPANQTLLDRKEELLSTQRDLVNSIQDEQDAIISLAEKGYGKLKESLDEVIDKRKEALNAEKSLYDYQKSIEEKTNKRDSLQKQLNALSGDTSEEARIEAQKLQLELNEANKDLEQTQYDKWISDQEQMLDNFATDTQEWIDERLKDTNGLLAEIRDSVANSSSIDNVLKTIANEYGIELSSEMLQTLSTSSNVDTSKAIDSTKSLVKMSEDTVKISDNVAKILDEISNVSAKQENVAYNVNLKGYASGSHRIPKDQLAITQEKGLEFIARDGGLLTSLNKGDMIFTNEMTERLWKMAQGNIPFGVVQPNVNLPVVEPKTQSNNITIDLGNLTLPNVKNYEQFKDALIRDSSFEKSVKSMALDKAFGRNSLNKLRY